MAKTPLQPVPQLRFPNFRKSEEWETKPISKLAHIVKGVQLNRAAIIEGEFPVWNGGVTPSGFHNEWNTEGETITISEGGNSCGFVNHSNQRFWLGGHCYALKIFASEFDGDFLFQSLKSNETEIMRLRVGSGLPNIQRQDLERFPVDFPCPAEQRKISGCLGSLDDLIAAEDRKLESLRRHKQGLMQQLFPQASETLPRQRFREFLNVSKLDEKTIGDVCNLKAGDFVPASEIVDHAEEGLFPCYGGNGLRGYVKSFTHEGRYILVGRQGALCGNVNLFSGKFHATEHALVATPKSEIDSGWLFYALDVLNLNRFSIGQAQPGLSVGVLRDVRILVPIEEDEQRKIADCLSSLDARLAAQIQKIIALKTHKQGLQQQLFPSLETV